MPRPDDRTTRFRRSTQAGVVCAAATSAALAAGVPAADGPC